jgi:fructokinase
VSAERLRLGIDLGGTKIEGVLLDAGGDVRRRQRRPTPRDDYEGTLAAIQALVADLEAGTPGGLPLGLGTPGAISPATGRIKNANSTWLNDRPLVADLERLLGRPLRVANDADCFALSEATDGAARGADPVFGVILGTGVGGGVVVGGRPLAGLNAIAGEWGHNPLPAPADDERPGPRCYCGRFGCIETWLSGPGLARDHLRVSGLQSRPEEIVAAADGGDAGAAATLERYCVRLARALAGVINLLDPEVIVLGGGLSRVERLYRRVPELWDAWVFSDRVDTRLSPPLHGDASGVRGAAWLWPLDETEG